MLDIKEVETRTGTKIPFTTYFGLKTAIPLEWRDYMSNFKRTQEVSQPTIISWMTRDKKGGQNLRKIWDLSKIKDKPIGQTKWITELSLHDNVNWKILYTMGEGYKVNIRSKYFQYQVLHRTIMTNRKLLQFNLRDNENCDFCGNIETISHLLYECNHIRNIWDQLISWLRRIKTDELYTDETSLLLGNNKNTLLVNYIFITLKHEVYKFKWKQKEYKLINLKRTLKNCMNIELYNGNVTGKYQKILGKWSLLLNEMR